MNNTASFMRRTWRTKTAAMRKKRSTASFSFSPSDDDEEEPIQTTQDFKEDPAAFFDDSNHHGDEPQKYDSVQANDRRLSQFEAGTESEDAATPPVIWRTASRVVHHSSSMQLPLQSNREDCQTPHERDMSAVITYQDRPNNICLILSQPPVGPVTAQLSYVDRDGTLHDICLKGKSHG